MDRIDQFLDDSSGSSFDSFIDSDEPASNYQFNTDEGIDAFLDEGVKKQPGYLATLANIGKGALPRIASWLGGTARAFGESADIMETPGARGMDKMGKPLFPRTNDFLSTYIDSDQPAKEETARRGILGARTITDIKKSATSYGTELAQAAQGEIQRIDKELGLNQPEKFFSQDQLKYYLKHGGDSLVSMIPMLLTTIVTKNPELGLSFMGTQVYGDKYHEMRERGFDKSDSQTAAMFYTAAETIPERIPLGILTKEGGKLLSRVLKSAGAEGLQEGITEILEFGYDKGVLTPDMKWGELPARVRDAMILGAGAGGGLAAIAHPLTKGDGAEPDTGAPTAFTREGVPAPTAIPDVSLAVKTDQIKRAREDETIINRVMSAESVDAAIQAADDAVTGEISRYAQLDVAQKEHEDAIEKAFRDYEDRLYKQRAAEYDNALIAKAGQDTELNELAATKGGQLEKQPTAMELAFQKAGKLKNVSRIPKPQALAQDVEILTPQKPAPEAAGATLPTAVTTTPVEPGPPEQAPLSKQEILKLDQAQKRSKAARERYGRESGINPRTDSLLAAIAKLGGISREDAKASGIDPANFKMKGWKIKPVFTTNGDSLDGMAERLAQDQYPVFDAQGNYNPNTLLDNILEEIAGNKRFSAAGQEIAATQQAEAREEVGDLTAMDEAAGAVIERPDNDFLLDDEEYDGLETTDEQHFADITEFAADQGLDENTIEAILERGAIQGLSNEDIKRQLTEAGQRVRAQSAELAARKQGEETPAKAAPATEEVTTENKNIAKAVASSIKPENLSADGYYSYGDQYGADVDISKRRDGDVEITVTRRVKLSGKQRRGADRAYRQVEDTVKLSQIRSALPTETIQTIEQYADTPFEPEQDVLSQYTESDLQRQEEAKAARVETERKATEKAEADAAVGQFALAGSDAIVDQAEARGQKNLFDLNQPAKPAVDADQVAKQPEQPDSNYHYTNGLLGMKSDGSFTKDKNLWMTFDYGEAQRMDEKNQKPYGATQRGIFVGTESGSKLKHPKKPVTPQVPTNAVPAQPDPITAAAEKLSASADKLAAAADKIASVTVEKQEPTVATEPETEVTAVEKKKDETLFSQEDKTTIEDSLKSRKVKGDDLLNAMDLYDDLMQSGAEISDDGYATLYHRTTPDNADKIKALGYMTGKEDRLFFGTKPNGQIEGYGEAVVKVLLPLEKLELNDVFTDEAHVTYKSGRPGSKIPINGVERILSVENSLTTTNPTETTKAQVQAWIATSLAAVNEKTGLKVKVITTEEIPKLIKDYLASQGSGLYIKGFYHAPDGINGSVYLVADALDNARDANLTFAHEVVGHFGVEKITGEEGWREIMGLFESLINNRFQSKAYRNIMADINRRNKLPENPVNDTKEQRIKRVKEFIAVAAEYRADQGALGQFLRKVRELITKALRSMGFKRPFSMTDIDTILSRSEAYLRTGETEEVAGDMEPAFSQQKTRKDWVIKPEDDTATRAVKMLAQDDETFLHPDSAAKTVEGIAADMPRDVSVTELDEATKEVMTAGNVKRAWHIEIPFEDKRQSGDAILSEFANGTVELNISSFEEGTGGSMIYHIAANYAHNNGLVFVGDQGGLSAVAQIRRTEQMLSSAAKYGTTKHLYPHELQRKPDVKGVAKLAWKAGDHDHNFRSMLRATIETWQNLVPEIREISYNFSSNRFEWRETNEPVTEQDFDRIVKRARATPLTTDSGREIVAGTTTTKTPAGSGTLKRAVLFQSALEQDAGLVLDSVSQQRTELLSNFAGGKLYYSQESKNTALDKLRKYYSNRTWDTEPEAKEYLRRRITEDNEKYGHLFKPTNPDIVNQFKFVKSGNKVKISQSGLGSRPEIDIVENPPPGATVPRVDWNVREAMEYGGRGEYWINTDSLPKEKMAGGKSAYDFNQFSYGKGALPPATIRLNKNGTVSIVDGNHRINYWNEQGMTYVPVRVIDNRTVQFSQSPQTDSPALTGTQTAPSERLSDSLSANAKLLSDIIKTDAFRAHGLGGFDVPSQRIVMTTVGRMLNDSKIFEPVIGSVPVDVMNILIGKKVSTDMLLHNPSVLTNLLAVNRDDSVPFPINEATTLIRTVTRMATENLPTASDARQASADNGPTVSTGIVPDIGLESDIAGKIAKNRLSLNMRGKSANAGAAIRASEFEQLSTPYHIKDSSVSGKATISTYDPSNPNILFSVEEEPAYVQRLREKQSQLSAPKQPTPTVKFTNTDTEKRYQQARLGLADQRTLLQRVDDLITHTWHGFTRRHIDLPNEARFALANEALRQYEAAPQYAKEEAIRQLTNITKDMSKADYDLFTRKIILDDLSYEAELGHDLPFGYSNATLIQDKTVVDAAVAKNKLIQERLQYRQSLQNIIRDELVKADILTEEQAKNPAYFRHQVLTYARARQSAQGTGNLKTPKPGYAKRRHGSLEDINANYLEAEFEYLHRAMIDLKAVNTIQKIARDYDVSKDMKQQAKDKSKLTDQKVDWRDLLPEGYRLWQPDKGNLFFTGLSVPERVINQLMDTLAERDMFDGTVGVPEVQEVIDAMRKSVMMGGKKFEMAIPEELAATLDKMRPDIDAGLFDHVLSEPLKWWKQWVLINPRRVLKYNLNNLSGDLDAVIAGNPKAVTRLPKAIKELWGVMHGAEPSKRYKEAIERGVFDAGLTVQEIPDINLMDPFQDIIEKPTTDQPVKFTLSKMSAVWRVLRNYTRFRENWMRYAAYLDYVDRLEAGESIGYGASDPEMVDEIAADNLQDAAALLARDLVGDYGNVSAFGQGIRKKIIPFYSWMEVNTARYLRLLSNAYQQGIGKGLGTTAAIGAIKGARTTAWLGTRMVLLYTLVQIWNNLMMGDDEDELSEADRVRLHINLGRDSDGNIRTIRFQGALSDFLQWFGAEDAVAALLEIEKGRASWTDVVKEVAKGPINKVVSGITPVIKTPVELLTGLTFFPDAFNPRVVRDKKREVAQLFSIENEYDWISGRPSRGYGKSLTSSFVYKTDPGEAAYNKIRGLAYDYNKRVKGTGGFSTYTTPRSTAVYEWRLARRFKDKDAEKNAFDRMREMGMTFRDIAMARRNADPLDPISKKDRFKFMRTLTPAERQTLNSARQWYRRVYLQ